MKLETDHLNARVKLPDTENVGASSCNCFIGSAPLNLYSNGTFRSYAFSHLLHMHTTQTNLGGRLINAPINLPAATRRFLSTLYDFAHSFLFKSLCFLQSDHECAEPMVTSSRASSGGDDHPEVSHKFGDVEQ